VAHQIVDRALASEQASRSRETKTRRVGRGSAMTVGGEELRGRAEPFDVTDTPAVNCDRRCLTTSCPRRDRRSRPG
jgi:hypothetical protein